MRWTSPRSLDPADHCQAYGVAGGPGVTVHQLALEGGEERFCGAVVPAHPGRTHRLRDARAGAQAAKLPTGVLARPGSKWNTTLSMWPPRVATAILSASQTSSARRWSASAQPITRREYKSITVARYSQPWVVRR